MKKISLKFILALILISISAAQENDTLTIKEPYSSSSFDGLKFRSIGPG